jgi:hypothetical protein
MSMPYVVQAVDPSRNDAISTTVADRKDALGLAVDWAAQGCTGVRIIGDGRIYTAQALAAEISKQGPRPA